MDKMFLALTKDPNLLLCTLFFSNCNTGISFHSVMQNIFITFEAEPPPYPYAINLLHNHERGDIQYFIDMYTIIRAKRDCKDRKKFCDIQI